MYFRFLEGTPVELYFDYADEKDPPENKFLVIRPSPESQQQLRFSVAVDKTLHGYVTLEAAGTMVHQLQRITA